MTLSKADWDTLIRQINANQCTPVIGAGASAGVIPSADKLAGEWADEFDYPLRDSNDLARVAQYISLKEYPDRPRELIFDRFINLPPIDLRTTPYARLAKLPFSLYITTNYDDLIRRSLIPNKSPKVDYCQWNNFEVESGQPPPSGRTHTPSIAAPLIYHLHGLPEWPQSLVVTEEDYLDFLITAAETSHQQSPFLRSEVRRALAGTSLLFIGYRLSDWTFRVLFRGLMRNIKAIHGKPSISIQLSPGENEVLPGKLAVAQSYLQKYLTQLHRVFKLNMYWGDATQFADELFERWEEK